MITNDGVSPESMFSSRYWRWLHPRRVLRELLSLDDSQHAIALGAALGMWVGMTPTVGIQMPILFTLWLLVRRWMYFNVTASLLMVMISNPLTTPPIYWFNYRLGQWFLGGTHEISFEKILTFESFAGWWEAVKDLVFVAGWPLLVGSLITATVLGIPTYWAMLSLLKRFRDPISAPGHEVVSRPVASKLRGESETGSREPETFSEAV